MLQVGSELVCMQPSIKVQCIQVCTWYMIPVSQHYCLAVQFSTLFHDFCFNLACHLTDQNTKEENCMFVNSRREYNTASVTKFTFSNTDPSGTVTLMQKCWPVSHLFTVYASSIS